MDLREIQGKSWKPLLEGHCFRGLGIHSGYDLVRKAFTFLVSRKHLRTISWEENEEKSALSCPNFPDAGEESLAREQKWLGFILNVSTWFRALCMYMVLRPTQNSFLPSSHPSFCHLFILSTY